MRVIAGTARGKKLLPVSGMETRPTTDRVKESVFNIIQTHIYGANVLDLFAGTGQMGIEALSRGAATCDFVDHSRAAQRVIGKNLEAARVADRAVVHGVSFSTFLSQHADKSYDVIFLDPPYGGELLKNALFLVERFDILSRTGIIVCESAITDGICTRLQIGRTYRYGTIQITTLFNGQEDR